MEEKYMILDTINSLKASLLEYQKTIYETENTNLRQKIQKIRDNYETFQFEIEKLAKQKGYLIDLKKVSDEEINEIKKDL